MNTFFLKIYDVLGRHKVMTVVLMLAFVAAFVAMALRVDYEEDISKFLPQNEQNEKYADVYRQINSQNRIAVIFEMRDTTAVVDTDSMEEAMEYLGTCLRQMAQSSSFQTKTAIRVTNLQTAIDEEKLLGMLDFVYRNAPYFVLPDDYERLDTIVLNREYIHNRLAEAKQQLIVTNGMAMQTLQYDPLQLFAPVMKRLQDLRMNDSFQLVDGYIFTKDGRHSMITFDSPYGSSETQKNAELAGALDTLMARTEMRFPSIRVSAIGAPLIAVTNARQIKTDSLIAVSIAVVLILVLLVWHYRRLSDIVWIGASISFGWLFAIAGMSVFYDSVSIIVLGIGSVIIGIAVNYPLHFLDHIREVTDRREALREMVSPLLIGNITTVAAFLCLVWLDAQAMRDLGAFGSLMLIGTILFVLVFLPLFAKAHKRRQYEHHSSRFRLPQIPYLFPLVCAITLVLGYFSLQTSFDSNLAHINYMTPSQRSDMELLASSVHDAPVYVVVEGKTLEEAAGQNRRVERELRQKGMPLQGVGDFLNVDRDSQVTGNEWNWYMNKDTYFVGRAPCKCEEDLRHLSHTTVRERLLTVFRNECRSLGFSELAFQPFVELISRNVSPRSVSYFQPLTAQFLGTYILKTGSGYRMVNYLHTEREELAKDAVRASSANAFAFSAKDIGNQLVDILNNSFNYVGFVCGCVVFFFLWLSFRRVELALMSFLPLAVGWIWILGLMQLLGIQFNIVNVILATFIFGQGDDYTIFITEGLLYEHTTGQKRLASYKRSVMLSAVLMFIGIGTLIFAKHPALRSLAEVTIIGMVTVVLMANYLPPLVFRWLVRADVADVQKRLASTGKTVPVPMRGSSSALAPTAFISSPLPLTLKRLTYSVGYMLFFLMFMYCGALPYTWLYFHLGRITERKRLHYHRLIRGVAKYGLRLLPGIRFAVDNRVGETFEKPAVIICNHQSHLDILSVLQFSPKLIIVTNGWTWHNPFYGSVLHHGDFLPAADGMEKNMPKLRELYKKGYSIVIFPEATRSADYSILRFHKGAFYLAHELGADILPLYIHGAGHVLPKKDFMLRQGRILIEVGRRVCFERYDDEGITANEAIRKMTKAMRHHYQKHYAELCSSIETDDYLAPYRKLRDYYRN